MNERQYQAVAKVCDEILKESRNNLARLSITWLHIVREHPVFMSRYTKLFTKRVLKRRYKWFGFKSSLAEAGRTLRQFLRATVHTFTVDPMRQTQTVAEVVFVAHLVNSDQHETDSDIYFDHLPAFLSQQGFKVAVLLIDHTTHTRHHHQLRITESGVTRIVLANTLGIREELRLRKSLYNESAGLSVATGNAELEARIRTAAAAEALSNAAANTMRIAIQVSKLAFQLNANVLITTFEGHAWERASYLAARELIPGLKCAGYQHAPLFRLQHGLQRRLYAECDPDILFTSGLAALKQLENTLAYKDIRNLGSARAGRQVVLSEAESFVRRKQPCCLVLLEGLINESIMLIEFSLKCAQRLPGTTFIWRTHPILPIKMLIKQCPNIKTLPTNIQVSQATLEEDSRKSRWVLYKGSSAVTSSVLAGTAPVYLDTDEQMTLDPLFAVDHACIKYVDDFISLIKADVYPTAAQSNLIVKHCLEIFTPLDFQVMVDYLNENNKLV